MKTVLLICASLLVSIHSLRSQTYEFSQWSLNEGLSQSVVNCIYQDSEGFLWIGTQNGLNRFDGYDFLTFQNNPNDTTTIIGNWIYDIVEDNTGLLWIGTKQGLSVYNKTTNQFTHVHFNKSESNIPVYGVFVTKDDNIIVNTPPTLHIYNKKEQNFTHFKSNIEEISAINDQKIPIIEDSYGLYWIGNKNGLAIFDPNNSTFINIKTTGSNKKLHKQEITALYQDSKGFIWIGTSSGFGYVDPLKTEYFLKRGTSNTINNTEQITGNERDLYTVNSTGNKQNTSSIEVKAVSFLKDHIIREIIQDKNKEFWIATESGLYKARLTNRFKALSFVDVQKMSNLNHEIVYDIIIDKSDNLWAGTIQGINKTDLKPKKFRLYRNSNLPGSIPLLDNVIASIYKENDSIIWVGNWGKGLNIVNRNNLKVEHYSTHHKGVNHLVNDYVHIIFEDDQHHIWLGTRDGLLVCNKSNMSFERPGEIINANIPDLRGHRIYEMIQDREGIYWIATGNGVYSFDIKSNTTKHYSSQGNNKPSLTNNLVYDIIEDKNNNIWIATGDGLNVLNKKSNTIKQYYYEYGKTNSICHNFTVSLCEDKNGIIWIGTQSGLNKFDPKDSSFGHYDTKDGLPANLIYEIATDNNNNVWLGTQNGLTCLDPAAEKFRTYSVAEGLQSVEFNLKAKYVAKDGEMFFGGMNGFNSFYPDSMFVNNFEPPVVITEIEKTNADGKLQLKYHSNSHIELNHNDYELLIEFAALDYTNPVLNNYAYKMEGKSDDWINIDGRRFVLFSSLPAGDYTFHIIGSNNDGIWNKIGSSINITVKPPWYRSSLAYITYILLVLLFIYLFIKYREARLIKERQILELRVAERTSEIAKQKRKVEKAHKEITSSINYASRIQTAMLPRDVRFDDYFKDHLLLYKPRDIVSGDFYWLRKINQYTIFAVSDCTGHGVPGAFVSMLGISLINEIIRRKEVVEASQVLELLRHEIKNALKQDNKKAETKDGMDIAFCIYNENDQTLDFAGAQNPVWIIREKDGKPEIVEYKGTPNPIGIHLKEMPFKSHKIKIEPNDRIYLFSDGYIDQFRSETNEKFKKRRLKEILLNNSDKTLAEQKDILEKAFEDWKNGSDQIDDILIMGVQIL